MIICRCPRCSDVTELGTNLSAFKCESCCEGLVLPVSTDIGSEWTCRFCGNPSSSTAVNNLIDKLESELFKILESDTDDTVQLLQRFISKNSRQLHSKHYLNIIGIKFSPFASCNVFDLFSSKTNHHNSF